MQNEIKTITYYRKSGLKIILKDTPQMKEFAKSQGWIISNSKKGQ